MEFVFRLSNYDDPALDAETAELLRQRLEARSRAVVPGMWKVTDKLRARAAGRPAQRGRRRRYRIYGVLLMALGVFALVPGLMEPRVPSLIWAGAWAVFAGLFTCYLAGERRPPAPPASCRKEAAELLAGRREIDWSQFRGEVRFDRKGITAIAGEIQETLSYSEITGVFETERLWLLASAGRRAFLLQKKDLVSGNGADFLPGLRRTIAI